MMTLSLTAVISTFVGGLILAGLVSWIKKNYLIVLVPRLFSHSALADRGQLAEITVFNRGFTTEEKVELSLNPSLQYAIIGSNSQDVSLTKNKVVIERIGPGDEVTIILSVEGGSFTKTEITNCLSKTTKGQVVSKLEEVPPTGMQRIALVAFLVVVPLIFYVGFDYLLGGRDSQSSTASKEQTSAQERADGKEQAARKDQSTKKEQTKKKDQTSGIDVAGWKIARYYETTDKLLFSEFKSGRIKVSLGKLARKGDYITVPVAVHNKTPRAIKYTLNMTTNPSTQKIPSYELMVGDVVVAPGASSEREIRVIVPEQSTDPSDRLIIIEVLLETADGDTLKMMRFHAADQ